MAILFLACLFLLEGVLNISLKSILSAITGISDFDMAIKLLVGVFAIILLFGAVAHKGYSLVQSFGIRMVKRELIFPVFLCGIGVVTFILFLEMTLRPIFPLFFELQQHMTFQIPSNNYSWTAGIMLMLNIVITPVIEELEFRGLLFNSASNSLGKVKGITISAIAFGVLHINPVDAIAMFLFGLGLGYVISETGSVIFPMTIHVFYNSCTFIINLLVSREIISSERPFSTMLGLIIILGGAAIFLAGVSYLKKQKKNM